MVMIPSQQGRDFSPMSLTNSSVLWNETALPSYEQGEQAEKVYLLEGFGEGSNPS
jgi:hypothetical protein